MAHGAELVAFAEAIVTGAQTLAQSRAAVVEALGPEAMVDAAGVASNFERMVRIADATGIELGDLMLAGRPAVRTGARVASRRQRSSFVDRGPGRLSCSNSNRRGLG